MTKAGQLAKIDRHINLLPYPGAPDNEARLSDLEPRLRADEPELFAPAKAALRSLKGNPPVGAHAVCWLLIARWHYYHNEAEAIQECAGYAVKIADAIADNGLRARSRKALALSFQETGRPAEAITVLVDALQHAEAAHLAEETAEILTNLSIALRNCAQYGAAYECLRKVLDLRPYPLAWENLSTLLLMVGDISGGLGRREKGWCSWGMT